MKLELLTNATVVDDAVRFVSTHKMQEKKTEKENAISAETEGTYTGRNSSYNATF